MIDWSQLATEIHADNIRAGWWKVDENGQTIPRNVGELLCLVHSEVSEAVHGSNGWKMDDHLPHRKMAEVELADVVIRVCDMLGFYAGSDLPKSAWGKLYHRMWSDWMLDMHSRIDKAMEHFRKGRVLFACEELVFLLEMCEAAAEEYRFDLIGAIAEKRAYNAQRADHKPAARAAEGGKAF